MRPAACLLGVLLVALPALGDARGDEPVLAGQAAYGGWRSDQPGRTRLIRPADMPPPYATSNAASHAALSRPPAGAAPQVPAGFAATRVAAGLDLPRELRTAPDGTVFLAESGGGRIRILHLHGAQPATLDTFAEGLDRPYGIAFWPPGPSPRFVYVATQSRVVRFPWQPGSSKPAGAAETIVPRLPTGGHWTRDIQFSPDGNTLFVAVGSHSNAADGMPAEPPASLSAWQEAHGLGAAWGEETGRAQVLRFDPTGKPRPPLATGLRNCAGLGTDPGGALWCVVNERDGLGDNLPPDYATRVREGAFYGWPWFYIGDHPDPRLAGKRPDLASQVTVPDVLIQPHSAPLGIAFYTGSAFPAEYRGDAFVTLHGSWNRSQRTGYKVVRLRMKNGQPTGAYEDFLTGFVSGDDTVWGRPVGVAMAADGSLLVSEDANGTVWRIAARS